MDARHRRALGLPLVFGFFMQTAPVQAELFMPLPTGAWAKPSPPASAPSGAVQVEPRLFQLNPQELWLPSDSGEHRRTPPRLQLNGFGTQALTATLVNERLSDDGAVIWHGRLEQDPMADVWLSLRENAINGHIRSQGRVLQIRHQGEGVHQLATLNPNAMPFFDDVIDPARKKSAQAKPEENQAPPALNPSTGFDDGNTIRILALYSSLAKQGKPDIEDLLTLEFAEANEALAQSGLGFRLEKVKTIELDTRSLTSEAIDALPNAEGPFANVPRLRARHQADLVHYFGIPNQWVCGVAYLTTYRTRHAWPEWGYGVTSDGCLGNLTMIHELGHNLGAHHDRYVNAGGDDYFNYGYVDTDAKIQTIMAYYDRCSSLGLSCTRLARFSNPTLNYDGRPLGIPEGQPGAADNAKVLRQAAATVANYQRVAPPTDFNVSQGLYPDRVELSWQSVPGATGYFLQRSQVASDGRCLQFDQTESISLSVSRYTDQAVTPGQVHCYRVFAERSGLYPGARLSLPTAARTGYAGSYDGLQVTGLENAYRLVGNHLDVEFTLNRSAAVSVSRLSGEYDNPLPNGSYAVMPMGDNRFRLVIDWYGHEPLGRAQFIVQMTDGAAGLAFPVLVDSGARDNGQATIDAPALIQADQGMTYSFELQLRDDQLPSWEVFKNGLWQIGADDLRLLPAGNIQTEALDWAQGRLRITLKPSPGFYGDTLLRLAYNDGDYLVSKHIPLKVRRTVFRDPVVKDVDLYWPAQGELSRLLPGWDPDDDAISFSLVRGPSRGQLTMSDSAFTYRPNPGATADSFRIAVRETGSSRVQEAEVRLRSFAGLRLPQQARFTGLANGTALISPIGEVYISSRVYFERCNLSNSLSGNRFHKLPVGNQWAQLGETHYYNGLQLLHRDGSLWSCIYRYPEGYKLRQRGNERDWVAISPSGNWAIKADGSLWSHDYNDVATQVTARYDWREVITAANLFVRDSEGSWWSGWESKESVWPWNLGRHPSRSQFEKIAFPSGVKNVQAQYFRGIAQDAEGWLWGWGSNSAHQFPGALPMNYITPQRFGDGAWDDLALGGWHAAGVRQGELWTWGGGGRVASLGRGPTAAVHSFARVGRESDWTKVYAGGGWSGVTFATKADGSLWVAGWDENQGGALGLGSLYETYEFKRVSGLPLGVLGGGDQDGDGIKDEQDPDDDGDGVADDDDALPWDARDSRDSDGDGIGDNAEWDNDDDGMADGFETYYGLDPANLDGQADADGDGVKNVEEYRAGSDPRNAQSTPRLALMQAPFITGSGNSNPTEVVLINTGEVPVPVVATLYHENGQVLGEPQVTLEPALAPKASLVLTARQLEQRFYADAWGQRARLELVTGKNLLRVINRVRGASGVPANMSCTAETSLPFLPSPDNRYKAVVRIMNTSNSTKSIYGTLRDEAGSILGQANALLAQNLPPHATAVYETSAFAARFGLESWRQKAWLQLHPETEDVALMAVIRSEDASFDNLSCTHRGYSLGLPGTDQSDQTVLRMLWSRPEHNSAIGRLHNERGEALSEVRQLSAAKSLGVVFKTRDMLAQDFGIAAWTGHANLFLNSGTQGGEMLQITRNPNGILSETGCSTEGFAYALPGGNQDDYLLRVTNLGEAAKDVRASLFGANGQVLGDAQRTLTSSLPAKGSASWTLAQVKSAFGAQWNGYANLAFDPADNLRVAVFNRTSAGVLTNVGCPAR